MIHANSTRHPIEILAAEFVERHRQGEHPSVTEYAVRHPELAERIRSLFPTVMMMEDLKNGWSPGPPGNLPVLDRVPERLGEYRIIREIGRGGMGIVYEAEQESLGRRVAVKVLTAPALLAPDQFRRFHREAQTMARMHHTNIVPVFAVDEHEGLSYYAMQFIDGRGLDAVIRGQGSGIRGQGSGVRGQESEVRDQGSGRGPAAGTPRDPCSLIPHPWLLTPVKVAKIGLQVAQALAYAHSQGTFHRDIKPSNLLLDERGRVWLTDFGLAKLVELDDGTQPGELAGTLRYMAPERFRGQSDARCDVYSLGLTLYELLTLRPAFDELDRSELARQITENDPPAPRQYDRTIPRDLERIVLKASARDPNHRYPCAGELADDLRRFLDDKPVQARPLGPAERFWRWRRRNPAVAGLTAVTTALLVLVAVVASAGYVQTRAALGREAVLRAEAQGQRQRAEANLDLALRAFDEIYTQVTQPEVEGGPAPGLASEEASLPMDSPKIAALLHNLLKFYDQFGERNRADPRLQWEIAKAYRRGGDYQRRLGQFDKAETAYRRALALHAARTMMFPAEEDSTREEAAIRNKLGLLFQTTGRYAEAEKLYRQAVKMLTPRAETAPLRLELARTSNLLGSLQGNLGQAAEGEQNHRIALELLNDLVQQDPANPHYRLAQARGYHDLSVIQSLMGHPRQAVAAHRRAVTFLEQLVKDFPTVSDYRYELSEALMATPTKERKRRCHGEVERQLRRAAGLAGELALGFPAVPEFQALRARGLQKLGAFLQASGRSGEAQPFDQDAVALQRALVRQFPSVLLYQLYRAEACGALGTIRLQRGELVDACSLLNEAIDALQAFLAALPENGYGRLLLAREYQNLGEVLRRQGNLAQADEALGKAATVRQGVDSIRRLCHNRRDSSANPVGRHANPALPCR
jgi:serine/threonine protein kinase/tetratricopeptide (TPR) repeat protein